MMPIPKGATAWEMEPQRKMRAVFFNTFGSGVMVGVAMGAAHEHRWGLFAWLLATAALSAYSAWARWRKIP